ncbi:MAG: hypothetical protein ABFD54_00710 [Armatimonadota bacterium]
MPHVRRSPKLGRPFDQQISGVSGLEARRSRVASVSTDNPRRKSRNYLSGDSGSERTVRAERTYCGFMGAIPISSEIHKTPSKSELKQLPPAGD